MLGGAFFGLFLLGFTYICFAVLCFMAQFLWAAGTLAVLCALMFAGLIAYWIYGAL